MENKVIILTRGIQGSGKSTWAKKWVAEDPLTRIRYNNDDIRHMQGVYWPTDKQALNKKEKIVIKIKNFIISSYMDAYYDIVVDNMNLNPKEYEYFNALIAEFNANHSDVQYSLKFEDFIIPVEECIARDAQRPNPIGATVIKQTYNRYRNEMIKIETEKLLAKEAQIGFNPLLPGCIIADMDATICFNVTGRPFFGKSAAENMPNDKPNMPVIKLIQNYLKCANEADRVFIITGREETEDIKNATYDYVKKHVSTDSRIVILMRPDKNHEAGTIIKKMLYDTYIKDKYNVDYVLDDSQKIVDMYRDMGLTVLQPNAGKF